MARTTGSSIIGRWEEGLTEEQKIAFRRYCKDNRRRKAEILAYLVERGCQVGISTVYAWVAQNIPPGEEALLLNAESGQYSGIDTVNCLESIYALLYKAATQAARILERDGEDITLNQALMAFPQYTREMRSIADLLEKTKTYLDFESAVLSGAARMVEIILNMPTVRDTNDEDHFKEVLQSALLQVKEELKSASPP